MSERKQRALAKRIAGALDVPAVGLGFAFAALGVAILALGVAPTALAIGLLAVLVVELSAD